MANESKTELLVYDHFKKFEDKITIEPKKSSNPAVDKLLQNASKKGNNKGYPEYIISFNEYPDLLIVIECKADNQKHQSNTSNFDKYADYAVDGALLYASFLQKEFNVIAIGISGETKKNLKASHFLLLKEQKNYTPIFGNELLDIDSYIQGFLKSPEKFKQDYDSLIKYSKKLNEDLHNKKVKENQRSLLISGIMIALDNRSFAKTYQEHATPKDLAENLVTTVITQLKNAKIGVNKLESIEVAYSFIKVHAALANENEVLVNLIKEIDSKINSFIRSHKYFDVLSEFYIEFLRKSNSDKSLGIVLTPHHITDLFNSIANTNKESVVFDNCTGTSGFLVSAMRAMFKDAKGDILKEDNIKQKQLIGIEEQSDIYALACSNMYLQGDGKSNLIYGDCFKEEHIKKVKSFNPNIGFLNPPYKANKKKDTEELEFVLNNMECLVTNGICVAIIPMQCALAQKGKILELKKRLLSKHTLEAVMSMPDELFFNSNVGVVSCIMVFTAHKPHPKNKETYFGYWKDDGFVKRKIKGRFDAFNKWQSIKEKWLESYVNKKSIAGLSVMKSITVNDEWCAEAYMETDYSTLTEFDFIKTIKDFVFTNELYIKKWN
ncbi:MAG: HsdM family class I SAM-dependent methyltransferase [Bacteroidia bacterium]